MWRNHAPELPGQELRRHDHRRSARTLLSWALSKLASAASVPANVIDSFEMERQRPDAVTIGALQRVFDDVGMEFLPDDDVRVRAATPPDK